MYNFQLPIGDWSDDGHGRVVYFTVISNKPIEAVMQADVQIKSVTGIDLSFFCADYGDSVLPTKEAQILRDMGFPLYNSEDISIDIDDYDGDDYEAYPLENCTFYLSPVSMAQIWIFLLCQVDKELVLILDDENKNALFHDGLVGYGLFC